MIIADFVKATTHFGVTALSTLPRKKSVFVPSVTPTRLPERSAGAAIFEAAVVMMREPL